MTPSEAGYCGDGIQALDLLLETRNSKAFILLKDGKIVLQEGPLSIEDKTSTYLGQGWTSAPQTKEDLIIV